MAAGSLIYVGKSRLRRQVKKPRQRSKPKGSKSTKRSSLSSRGSGSSRGSSGRSSPSLGSSTFSLLNPEHHEGENLLENKANDGSSEVDLSAVKCADAHCCKFCDDFDPQCNNNVAAEADAGGFTEDFFFKGLHFSACNLAPVHNQYEALQQQDPEEDQTQSSREPQSPEEILPIDIFQGANDAQEPTEQLLPRGEEQKHGDFEGYVLLDDDEDFDEEAGEMQGVRTVGTQYEQLGMKEPSMRKMAAKEMKKLMKRNPCCTIM